MADLFSDGKDALFTPDQGTVQQQVIQEATPVPTAAPVPVPAEQDPLDREASAVGDPADTAGSQPGEGVEEVPDADPVNQVDYTELLTKQNELLESQQELLMQIVLKDEQIEHEMKNVQNAMPAVMCMLGVVIGVLLVHILASYIRP